MSGSGRKGKRLSSEDVEVWQSVARSVQPLRKRAPRVAAAAPVQGESKPPAPIIPPKARAPKPLAAPVTRPLSAGSLERRVKQKIARGMQAIEGRLDLHGHSQAEAYSALLRFLRSAQARGKRVVLVITGKGRGAGEGVLRRSVPLWLALPELGELVVGFDAAAPTHGGAGALYVRIRKRKAD